MQDWRHHMRAVARAAPLEELRALPRPLEWLPGLTRWWMSLLARLEAWSMGYRRTHPAPQPKLSVGRLPEPQLHTVGSR